MWLAITSGDPKNWRELYRAAVAETDNTRVPLRISEAEHAALSRVRELFYRAGNRQEKDDLREALCTLRAFRSASAHISDSEHLEAAA